MSLRPVAFAASPRACAVHSRIALATALLLWLMLGFAHAQVDVSQLVRRPLPATNLVGSPPVIDGDLSDSAWQSAARAETFIDPQVEKVAPDQTIAFICYDAKFIYVAFDCKDREPDSIVGRETVRDSHYEGDTGSEDFVEVSFDTFLSYKGQDFARFSVNPLGTRSARFGGGRAGKAEWNGDWDAAAKRTPTGWAVEMRIPWETLNYPRTSGDTLTMGINFARFQYRTRVFSIWSDTHAQGFNEFEGRWNDVRVPKNAFKPKLSLLPYVLPYIGETSDGTDGKPVERKASVRVGLDARYTITPELTSVASVNPDFATIEGAIQSIAFSRSEIFVPERRAFFLEGRDFFNLGAGFGPLFYSNRIRTFDAGGKVFGRLSPRDAVGSLVTVDVGRRLDFVGRYRRDLSPTAQFSVFATAKDYRDDPEIDDDRTDQNQVLAVTASNRTGNFRTEGQFAFSNGTDAGGASQAVNFIYEGRNTFSFFQMRNIDPDFRNANGLTFFTDFRGFGTFQEYDQEFRGTRGLLRRFSTYFDGEYTWRQSGKPFQRGIGAGASIETRSDVELSIRGNYGKFEEQTDSTLEFSAVIGDTNRFRQFGFRAVSGIQADRPYSFYGPSVSLRALPNLDLIYEGGIQELDGQSQQHILTLNYLLSRTKSIGGRVVFSTDASSRNDSGAYVPGESHLNWYLSYRNSGEKGLETYFILGDPNAQEFVARAALKFIFAI